MLQQSLNNNRVSLFDVFSIIVVSSSTAEVRYIPTYIHPSRAFRLHPRAELITFLIIKCVGNLF